MEGISISDVGIVRQENQDSARFFENSEPPYCVLVVCDGMGGAKAGGLASSLGVEEFILRLKEGLASQEKDKSLSETATEAVLYANKVVYERSLSDNAYTGMGTTLVAAVVWEENCLVINVGDSRAYLYSDGALSQITRDHSLVEEMVLRGHITREEAKIHPRRNIITRALGTSDYLQADSFTPKLKNNDLLLLCSDGLSNTVTDEELEEILSACKNLETTAKELLELSLKRGAPDNVTIGLLRKD